MRHRHDRDGDAREVPELGREHAAGIDHDRRLDRAPVRLDARDLAVLDADPDHARRGVDLGPPTPRSLGEREGELARVDVAVTREERGTENAVHRHRREQLLRLRGGDQLERQPERLRPARLTRDLLQPLGRAREPERAHLAPAGLETDLGLERPVQLDRVHHHPGQRERAAELADEAGGVEGGATREVGALDEDDVVPAEPRQPVEDGAPADAATDDDGAGARPHSATSVDSSTTRVRSGRKRSRANSTGVPSAA